MRRVMTGFAFSCGSMLSSVTSMNGCFGHRSGAFTGAVDTQSGMIGLAHRGTLFLAERREDIPLLADHFAGRCGVRLSVEAAAALGTWDWPGNVRQLKGLIERSAVFAPTGTIDQDALSFAVETGPRLLSARQAPQPPTGNGAAHLTGVCRRHGGDPEKIAADLGIGRSTLYRWLRKSGLELRRFRRPANAS
jgi:DNA-binding NtrC family response regulator